MVKTTAEMVLSAKERVENLTPDQAHDELVDQSALFVDIREPGELENGIIPGAHHAPRGMLEFYADPTSPYHQDVFDPSRRIVLYCASGGRSALAASTLQDMGYENVAHVDGGLKGWTQSGLATANGQG